MPTKKSFIANGECRKISRQREPVNSVGGCKLRVGIGKWIRHSTREWTR